VTLYVNGEARSLNVGTGTTTFSITELLSAMSITTPRVAVEVNRRLVPRAEFSGAVLREGDRVEIVQLVGGG